MKTYQKQLYLANIEGAKTNAGLEERFRKLEGGLLFQEQVARRELGWVRDGEILYEFLGEND
jgi:cell division protein FtsB